jgi:integrase
MNEEGFRAWMAGEDYRPSTIHKTVADLRSFLGNRTLADKPSSFQRATDYRWAWDLYHEYCEAEGEPALRKRAPPVPKKEPRNSPRLRRKHRKKQEYAVSIDGRQFSRLLNHIRADSAPTARVLAVLATTGLRVGDVLRVEHRQIKAAFERDDGHIILKLKGAKPVVFSVHAAPNAWKKLQHAVGRRRVVAAACNTKGDPNPGAWGPAYAAVRRKLRDKCASAKVDGRHNLHRLRRTVAVLLAKKKQPDEVIQRVLGHSDRATTKVYTDEAMADLAAEALQTLGLDQ